jgi:mannosyltransferase OCH1-like enzyme
MIPKKIHYCWFGGNPIPELAQKCIASWNEHCPEYEIKEWNETNFDINCCAFVKEAYEVGKWAFITDYVRLKVLYDEGGIYMDTDVEVIRNLDLLLHHPAFSGFESSKEIPTGIMASERHNRWIEKMLDYYKDRHFIKDGNQEEVTNVKIITELTKNEYGIKLDNTYQDLGDVVFYPRDYFCPKDYITGQIKYLTENTYTIHHFSGSWLDEEIQNNRKDIWNVRKKYGLFVGWLYRNYIEYGRVIKKDGLRGLINLTVENIKRRVQ